MSTAIAENVTVADPTDEQLEAAIAYEERIRDAHPDWDDDTVVEAVLAFERNGYMQPNVIVEQDDSQGVTQASEAKPVDPATERRKRAAEAIKAAKKKAADGYAKLHESSALAVYTAIGNDAKEAILLAKLDMDVEAAERKAQSGWRDADVDKMIADISLDVKAAYPHIFHKLEEEGYKANKTNKGIETHLSDYIGVALAYDCCLELVPSTVLDGVSYHVMVNFVLRKMILRTKVDVTARIKDGWAEFIRTKLFKLGRDELRHSEFIEEIRAHEAHLAKAKKDEANAGLNADQIAQKAKEAEIAAKNQADSQRRSKLNETLTTSLSKSLASNGLNRAVVGAAIKSAMAEHKVGLADIGFEPASAIDPKTCTADDVINLVRTLFLLKRFDEFGEIVSECAQMEAMRPKKNPPVSLAG